jgi:hypothetical protein
LFQAVGWGAVSEWFSFTDSSVGGDYYQASFHAEEETDDLDDISPYLLIQRDFEMSYGRSCYIETHDERYRGHFSVRRIEFTPEKLRVSDHSGR